MQVLADKLPKGSTVSVGVGGVVLRLGRHSVAVQVIDIPGDPRYAPLGTLFYHATPYVLLLFDVTSFESFTALDPQLEAFRRANPACDPTQHVCLVANEARVGMKHAVSPGLALAGCEQNGDMPFFEVDPEAPQGVLEPLRFLADHYLTEHGAAGAPAGADGTREPACAPGSGTGSALGVSMAGGVGMGDAGVGGRRSGRVLKGQTKGSRWAAALGAATAVGSRRSHMGTDARAPGPPPKVGWAKVLSQL